VHDSELSRHRERVAGLTERLSRGRATRPPAARTVDCTFTAAFRGPTEKEIVMKGRFITVYTLIVTATAVLAPLAEAGIRKP